MDSGTLQIILVTYNRRKFARLTLETLLADDSPVKHCDILVLDNRSDDGTADMVLSMMQNHPNLQLKVNRYNVGGAGNIFKAMELADHEYVWIIGDDDLFDFRNWGDVEKAIGRKEPIICLSRDFITCFKRDTLAIRAMQVSLITAGIVKTDLYSSEAVFDSCINIYSLSPHMIPIFHHLDIGGGIYVVEKSIVRNGTLTEAKDRSFDRGLNGAKLSPVACAMKHVIGYAAICNVIANRRLREECFMAFVDYIQGGRIRLLKMLNRYYRQPRLLPQLALIASVAPRGLAWVVRAMIFLGSPSWFYMSLCRLRKHWGKKRDRERFRAIFKWNSRFS